jgi:hypothetical protein
MTEPDSPRQPDGGEDPLDAISERLRSAQETAERLVREATAAAQQAAAEGEPAPAAQQPPPAGDRPPPRGWATPGGAGPPTADLQALAAILDLGRAIVPPELRAQIAELVRELLLLVRALIDWYLERIEERRGAPVEVQDIPIS